MKFTLAVATLAAFAAAAPIAQPEAQRGLVSGASAGLGDLVGEGLGGLGSLTGNLVGGVVTLPVSLFGGLAKGVVGGTVSGVSNAASGFLGSLFNY